MRRVVLKSPVLENCTPGSVRGAPGNRRPYLAKMKTYPIFLSSIFLSFHAFPQPLTSCKLPRSLRTTSTIAVQRAQRETGGSANGGDHLAGAELPLPKFPSSRSLCSSWLTNCSFLKRLTSLA
jgi:hypothetical protein